MTFLLFVLGIQFSFGLQGFHSGSSEHFTPEVVQAGNESVFQVVLLNGYRDIKTKDIDETVISRMTQVYEYDKHVLRLQLRDCKMANLETCRLWEPSTGLTGYLLGRGDMLVTAAHGFKRPLDGLARRQEYNGECPDHDEQNSGAEDYPLCYSFKSEKARERFAKTMREEGLLRQILVINSKREIVYSPEKAKAKTKIAVLPHSEKYPYEISSNIAYGYDTEAKQQFRYNPTLDWIVFKMPNILGEPLKIAEEVTPGEPVTLVGYPVETMREETANSDGNGLYFSIGEVLSFEKLFEVDPELTKMGYSQDNIFIDYIPTTTDGAVRFSGGPYLNQQGEAIGMIKTLMGAYLEETNDAIAYVQKNPSTGTVGPSKAVVEKIESSIQKLIQEGEL